SLSGLCREAGTKQPDPRPVENPPEVVIREPDPLTHAGRSAVGGLAKFHREHPLGPRVKPGDDGSVGMVMANGTIGGMASPLPTSPIRGVVPLCGEDRMVPQTRWSTLPLAGRAGEGVAHGRDLRGALILVRPYGTAA